MEIELRAGFCDPDGELVSVCEQRGLWELEAWRRGRDGSPHHLIGYWHPRTTGPESG